MDSTDTSHLYQRTLKQAQSYLKSSVEELSIGRFAQARRQAALAIECVMALETLRKPHSETATKEQQE